MKGGEDMTKDNDLPLAVVTGGGTGIGRAVGELLAQSGYRVCAIGLDRDDDLPAAIRFAKADVTDTEAALAALPEGPVAALVNCAGLLRHQAEWQVEGFELVMKVNLTAGFTLANALLDRLEAARGSVVNVTSIAGSRVHPFAGAAYSTSKAALAALTREMAHDFGPLGVRVNAIAPGEIETSILSPGTEKIVEKLPLQRLGQPSEVADVIWFLCSDQSSYISGAEIEVNGAQHV